MSRLAGFELVKMNGLGNEIAILDLRGTAIEASPAEARAIDAAFHFDQLMVLHDPRSAGTGAFMRILNKDGSESAACGNGTRCVAWWLTQQTPQAELILETDAGRLACTRTGEARFAVDMGRPRFAWNEIPLAQDIADPMADTRRIRLSARPPGALQDASAVNMGNPHAIFFVTEIAEVDLATLGPLLEHDPLFPERANISIAEILARDHLRVKVWERGAGLTKACGSAACASLVAAARLGLAERSARISLPGGDLSITWRDDDRVMMEGPVEFEFAARLEPSLFETAPA